MRKTLRCVRSLVGLAAASGWSLPPGERTDGGYVEVMEAMLSHRDDFAECIKAQHERAPGASGRVVMRWTIEPSGRTSNIGPVDKELRGTPLALCLADIIAGMKFVEHTKQGEPISFPFKF